MRVSNEFVCLSVCQIYETQLIVRKTEKVITLRMVKVCHKVSERFLKTNKMQFPKAPHK